MSSKHKVSQNDLRKFMSLHKQKLAGASKKVESPLAKYQADGTLKCIICDSVVRNEAVWTVHINSRAHKDNIAKKKQVPVNDLYIANQTSTRLINDASEQMACKRPSEEPPPPPKKLKSILKNGSSLAVPDGFFDTPNNSIKPPSQMETTPISTDDQKENEIRVKEVVKIEDNVPVASTSDLPEGFFDNPLLDAKARNVEYKDPIEEEWERFQKEMKEEVTLSTRIIEDESETATVERQILEVDEQLNNWSKVVQLEKKREDLQTSINLAQNVKKEDDSNSSSDECLDEFVFWRNKNSFR